MIFVQREIRSRGFCWAFQIHCRGGSCIVGSDGQFIIEPQAGGEILLSADLNFNDIIKAKYSFDVAGHYRRPDAFSLS